MTAGRIRSWAVLGIVVAAALVAGCGGSKGVSVLPPVPGGGSASGQSVTMNGTTAVIPVPTGLPYQTTLTYANASVISGTTVTGSGGSTLPSGLPAMSFKRSTQQLGSTAQLLEYVTLQPSQHLVGIDGLTMTAVVPASQVPTGVQVWAELCLTDLGDSGCQGWDGPFGPGTVTVSGSTATVSVVVPIAALPGQGSHTIALFAIPTGAVPTATPLSSGDVTSFLTVANDPPSDPQPIMKGDLHVYLSVNGGSRTAFIPRGVAYGNATIGQNGSNEPLDVSDSSVWNNDLGLIRGMHANALRVYSVATNAPSPPPAGFNLAPYFQTSYQGASNSQTVYTLLGPGMGAPSANAKTVCAGTTYTPLPANGGGLDYLSCYGATGEYNNWVTYYEWLARKWGGYPGVMGFVIGNETNDTDDVPSPGFWRQIANIAIAIRTSLAAKHDGMKLVVYSAVNDMNPNGKTVAMSEGETFMATFTPPPAQRSAGFDMWGYDVYEGPTFGGGCPSSATTCWFNLASQYTKRPITILEFGAPSSYHPTPVPGNTASPYPIAELLPHPTAPPMTYASPWPCMSQFPVSNIPTFKDVVTFYGCMQQGIDDYSVTSAKYPPYNVVTGGFVFELMDEYFKDGGGGCTYYHCASTSNLNYLYNNENSNGYLLFDDEAFLGLMAVGYASPSYAPGQPVNARTPRETYCWFQYHWSGAAPQYQAPCTPSIRFVNGAPSAGSVSWSVDGQQYGTNVPASVQASITAYTVMPASAAAVYHTITFANSSGAIATAPCVTPALLASSRTTIVLTGNGSSVPYACQIFDEPEVTNSQLMAVYHHAAAVYAKTNGGTTLYGLVSNTGTAGILNPTGLGFQAINVGGPAVLFDSFPYPPAGYGSASGIAFEVNSAGQTGYSGQITTLANFVPSSADSTDSSNWMPSTTGDGMGHSGADANVALFVVDNATGGVSLIGTFTP